MDKLGVNVFNCLGNENVRVKNIKDILSLIRNYSYRKPLTLESLNPFLKEVEYAIRGKMHLRAAEIGEQMREVCFVLFIFILSLNYKYTL